LGPLIYGPRRFPAPWSHGGADRRREQHRHSLGLALIPGGDQPLGILKHLGIGCSPGHSLFLGSLPALILHFALVEADSRIVAERG
jgi:hypothetical protein